MNTFESDNGYRIASHEEGLKLLWPNGEVARIVSISPSQVEALGQFFRAQEDERLGRWRYSESIVVYPQNRMVGQVPARGCTVLDEVDHRVYDRWESETTASAIDRTEIGDAARAYFAANPEPKPWRDACIGDVWVMGPLDAVYTCVGGGEDRWFTRADVFGKTESRELTDVAFTSGRRIWPEERS